METFAPATPSPNGVGPYDTPVETLGWSAPSWYEPTIPIITRQSAVKEETVEVPVIAMVKMRKGSNFVRAFDSMPDNGFPMAVPTNQPIPYETMGGGLNAPKKPAEGESWKIYNQYSPWALPRAHAGDSQPSGPGVYFKNGMSYTNTGEIDTQNPAAGYY